MRILLTRPYQQSLETKRQLEDIGCRVFIEPVLEIAPIEYSHEIYKRSKAFAVTSIHASSEIAKQEDIDRNLPVYAVGSATAMPLKDAGFTRTFEAEGHAASLLTLIKEKHESPKELITYLSGWHITQDIARVLAMQGFEAQRVISYKANAAKNISEATKVKIINGEIDIVIFMSFRTAFIFQKLCKQIHLNSYLQNICAVVLSQNVARGLNQTSWKNLIITEKPSQNSLITKISQVLMTEKWKGIL